MKFTKRQILGSIGMVAATGAATFGSGAFTQVEAERAFTVGLAGDDTESQLVIEENSNLSSAAVNNNTGDDSFEFSATEISPDAITTFGRFKTITDATSLVVPAFFVRNENNTGEDVDVTFAIGTNDSRDAVVKLAVVPPSGVGGGDTQVTATSGEDSESITIDRLPSTENTEDLNAALECGVVVDTTASGVDNSADLDISLTITAERSGEEV